MQHKWMLNNHESYARIRGAHYFSQLQRQNARNFTISHKKIVQKISLGVQQELETQMHDRWMTAIRYEDLEKCKLLKAVKLDLSQNFLQVWDADNLVTNSPSTNEVMITSGRKNTIQERFQI